VTFVHVLSVHFRYSEWLPLQRRYLDNNLVTPSQYYFSIEDVDAGHFRPNDYLTDDVGLHQDKLDDLVETVLKRANPDDWLLFIDSDAFLLTDLTRLMNLGTDLVAVQRRENGDFHPHPCFTLVRARLWDEIGQRNWREGTWVTSSGVPATEMGGLLLERVTEMNIPWTKLTRVNVQGLHRLWFGVYGLDGVEPVVYHHGAGSRARVSRSDLIPRRYRPKAALQRAMWALENRRGRKLGLSLAECWGGRPEVLNGRVMTAIERYEDFWKNLL
jgi:hypothetical protein